MIPARMWSVTAYLRAISSWNDKEEEMMNRQMTQGTVANNVQVIPATKRRVSAGGQLKKAKDIRVAAYGRVSTDELAQQTSYEGRKAITRS